MDLPDWVEVFPAHFEGTCGKDMCGRPSSTIGFERRFNPMLQLDEGDFVRRLAEPSPRPPNMTAIVASNQGRTDYAWIQGAVDRAVDSVSASQAPSKLKCWWKAPPRHGIASRASTGDYMLSIRYTVQYYYTV